MKAEVASLDSRNLVGKMKIRVMECLAGLSGDLAACLPQWLATGLQLRGICSLAEPTWSHDVEVEIGDSIWQPRSMMQVYAPGRERGERA